MTTLNITHDVTNGHLDATWIVYPIQPGSKAVWGGMKKKDLLMTLEEFLQRRKEFQPCDLALCLPENNLLLTEGDVKRIGQASNGDPMYSNGPAELERWRAEHPGALPDTWADQSAGRADGSHQPGIHLLYKQNPREPVRGHFDLGGDIEVQASGFVRIRLTGPGYRPLNDLEPVELPDGTAALLMAGKVKADRSRGSAGGDGQDRQLYNLVAKMVIDGCSQDEAYQAWWELANSFTWNPKWPWTDSDFARHWNSASDWWSGQEKDPDWNPAPVASVEMTLSAWTGDPLEDMPDWAKADTEETAGNEKIKPYREEGGADKTNAQTTLATTLNFCSTWEFFARMRPDCKRLDTVEAVEHRIKIYQDKHPYSRDWNTAPAGARDLGCAILQVIADRGHAHKSWFPDLKGQVYTFLTKKAPVLDEDEDGYLHALSAPKKKTDKEKNYPGCPQGVNPCAGKSYKQHEKEELLLEEIKRHSDGKRRSYSARCRYINSVLREELGLHEKRWLSVQQVGNTYRSLLEQNCIHETEPPEFYVKNFIGRVLPAIAEVGPGATPHISSVRSRKKTSTPLVLVRWWDEQESRKKNRVWDNTKKKLVTT